MSILPEWCESHWPDPGSQGVLDQRQRKILGRPNVFSPGSLSGTSGRFPAAPGDGATIASWCHRPHSSSLHWAVHGLSA